MIVLLVIVCALFVAIFFLRGEGARYGKCNARIDQKKRVRNITDKNVLL